MKINVAQQLKESVGSVRHYEIDETGSPGFPISGKLQLLRTNLSILVSGRLDTYTGGVCSRCLEEFEYPLSLDIEEEFFITNDLVTGSAVTPPVESGSFTIDENHLLDLDEAIRQYTLLAQPMKPICRNHCAGLCPQCGRNLNNETCKCKPVSADSPWAPLQKLLSVESQIGHKERG